MIHVFDASALIAYPKGETGAAFTVTLLQNRANSQGDRIMAGPVEDWGGRSAPSRRRTRMDPLAGCAIRAHVADLPDPRVARARRHERLDVVAIALCAAICGADGWVDVEAFGRAELPWLRSFLALPHGVPSHDTFGRVFAALDPAAFEAAFLGWVRAIAAATAGGVVAVDGKTLRRSHGRAGGRGPLHLVSAWATANGLVLGQVAVGGKSRTRPPPSPPCSTRWPWRGAR